jgi:hypothetical protein
VATVVRASAGTSELLPTATATSAEEAATVCRLAGMRVACAIADAAGDDLHDADLTGGLFLLIGGERRGVTRSFVEQADQLIRIGYGREGAPGARRGDLGRDHRVRGAAPAADRGALEDARPGQRLDRRGAVAPGAPSPGPVTDEQHGDGVERREGDEQAVAGRERAEVATDGRTTDDRQAADGEADDRD